MLPYSAQDLVRVMRDEMRPEDERRFGAQIARDVRRDDDRDDANRPDRGERNPLRFHFLLGTALGRSA